MGRNTWDTANRRSLRVRHCLLRQSQAPKLLATLADAGRHPGRHNVRKQGLGRRHQGLRSIAGTTMPKHIAPSPTCRQSAEAAPPWRARIEFAVSSAAPRGGRLCPRVLSSDNTGRARSLKSAYYQ